MIHLSATEAIWIIVSLVGLLLSTANAMDAADDRQFTAKAGLRRESMIAADMLRGEVAHFLVHALFLGLGWLAALAPSREPESLIAALLTYVMFFAVQIAMIANSLLSRRTRKVLIRLRLSEIARRKES